VTDRCTPLIIAHRGGAPGEIENSATAFEHALSLDVDMLEFDLRQSGDGQLVLAHNPVVYADGRRWVVQDTTIDTLRWMNISSASGISCRSILISRHTDSRRRRLLRWSVTG